MLYLNAAEIRKVFSMREAIESDREAFMIQGEGLADVPVRTNFARILIYGQVAFGRRSIVFTATLMGCSSEHYHKQTILSHCILF